MPAPAAAEERVVSPWWGTAVRVNGASLAMAELTRAMEVSEGVWPVRCCCLESTHAGRLALRVVLMVAAPVAGPLLLPSLNGKAEARQRTPCSTTLDDCRHSQSKTTTLLMLNLLPALATWTLTWILIWILTSTSKWEDAPNPHHSSSPKWAASR